MHSSFKLLLTKTLSWRKFLDTVVLYIYICHQKRKIIIFTFVSLSKSNHSSVLHPKGFVFGEIKNKTHFSPTKYTPKEVYTH